MTSIPPDAMAKFQIDMERGAKRAQEGGVQRGAVRIYQDCEAIVGPPGSGIKDLLKANLHMRPLQL